MQTASDYKTLLVKFMTFVWEDDCVVCERCANGTWSEYEPHEQATMNEILAALKELDCAK